MESFHFSSSMAGINGFLQTSKQNNHDLNSLFAALDPKSYLESQFSHFDRLQTEVYYFERGPRYKAYADLRESRLRSKLLKNPEEETFLTVKKQVKFPSFASPTKIPRASSILAQSVPDFSSVLRKENRKPSTPLPPVVEKKSLTPPSGLKSGRFYGVAGKMGGSKSANSGGEKNIRKSYANIDELKGLASAARNAINGGGRITRGAGKTILGSRQF